MLWDKLGYLSSPSEAVAAWTKRIVKLKRISRYRHPSDTDRGTGRLICPRRQGQHHTKRLWQPEDVIHRKRTPTGRITSYSIFHSEYMHSSSVDRSHRSATNGSNACARKKRRWWWLPGTIWEFGWIARQPKTACAMIPLMRRRSHWSPQSRTRFSRNRGWPIWCPRIGRPETTPWTGVDRLSPRSIPYRPLFRDWRAIFTLHWFQYIHIYIYMSIPPSLSLVQATAHTYQIAAARRGTATTVSLRLLDEFSADALFRWTMSLYLGSYAYQSLSPFIDADIHVMAHYFLDLFVWLCVYVSVLVFLICKIVCVKFQVCWLCLSIWFINKIGSNIVDLVGRVLSSVHDYSVEKTLWNPWVKLKCIDFFCIYGDNYDFRLIKPFIMYTINV